MTINRAKWIHIHSLSCAESTGKNGVGAHVCHATDLELMNTPTYYWVHIAQPKDMGFSTDGPHRLRSHDHEHLDVAAHLGDKWHLVLHFNYGRKKRKYLSMIAVTQYDGRHMYSQCSEKCSFSALCAVLW